MPLINFKQVKAIIKESGKQASPTFLIALDKKVYDILNRAIRTNKRKRLTAEDVEENEL